LWSASALGAAEGEDGFFEGCGDVIACICDDVSGARHVGLAAEPLAELVGVGDHVSPLSFDGHAAFCPTLGEGRADAQVFADDLPAFERVEGHVNVTASIPLVLNSGDVILDGEIVCVDETGRPIFDDLFERRGTPIKEEPKTSKRFMLLRLREMNRGFTSSI
jgi:hypothetical protein